MAKNDLAGWDEPAIKGDLLRAILDLRIVTGDLFDAVMALKNDDNKELIKALQKYLDHQKDLDKLMSELERGSAGE